jgi:7,8-dihydro-6-hydroxymethylpterin-pyrophosphokinase
MRPGARALLVIVALAALAALAAAACRGTVGGGAPAAEERTKDPMSSKPRNLVVGARSWKGSRMSLVNAADELLSASPVIQPLKAAASASGWVQADEGPDEFVGTAFAYKSALPPEQLAGLLHAVEERLADPREPRKGRSLRLDLLWMAGAKVRTAELTLPSPSLQSRRWAISALMQAGENAIVESLDAGDEDKGTARRFADAYKKLPGEPRWEGGVGDLGIPSIHRSPEAAVLSNDAVDFADLLAVGADTMAMAEIDWLWRAPDKPLVEREDEIDPAYNALRKVVPEDVVPVEVKVVPEMSEADRMTAFIAGVRATLTAHRAPLSRTVVFEVGPTAIRGALLIGKPAATPPVFNLDLLHCTITHKETRWLNSMKVVLETRRAATPR